MIFMVYMRKQHLAFISKPSNFDFPICGPFIHKLKYLAINRESPMKALRTLNVASGYISSGELSVGIFPEGTRSKTGELQKFHDGVFVVAKDTHCPIVVTTLRNTESVRKNFPFKRTVVELRVVSVIEPQEFEGLRTAAISNNVYEIMSKDLSE